MKKIRSRHFMIIFLFVIYGLIKVPTVAYAATDTGTSERIVRLDLSDNTLQFGGFPSQRDISDDIFIDQSDDRSEDSDLSIEHLYETINGAIAWQTPDVDVSNYGLTQEQAVIIISNVLNAEPRFFYVDGAEAVLDESNGMVESIQIDYADDSDAKIAEYENEVAKVLSGVNPKWNDEEKIFYLHDYIVTHCEYDYESYYSGDTEKAATVYSVLIRKTAVCSGYASAFSDLANRLGIEASYVSSSALNHAWNLVKLNDKHYYLDCTWDDPGSRAWYSCSHKNLLLSQTGITATRHNSTDWVSNWGKNTIYGMYDDTTYDNAAWHAADYSPVVCLENGILYLDGNNGAIYGYNCDVSEPQMIIPEEDRFKTWPVFGDPERFYPRSFGTMTACGNGVFFNDTNNIYRLDVSGGSYECIYSLSDEEKSKGQIFGISSDGGYLLYDILTDGYDISTKTDGGRVDASSFINYIGLDKSLINFEGLSGSETLVANTNSVNGSAIIWSTSNTSVAAITDGIVTPVGYGSAVITASIGDVWASCRVNVDTTWQSDFTYTGTRKPGITWSDQYEYLINTKDSFQITAYNGTDSSITIPASAVIRGNTYAVKKIDIYKNTTLEKIKVTPGTKLDSLSFVNCNTLIEADLSGVDVSNVTDMSSMFSGCSKLTDINLSGWDTSNVTSMSCMFDGCESLSSLDLSVLNTSNVTGMSCMFYGCKSLSSLDLSGWDTSNVTNMYYMFYGCNALSSLDVSGWDTSNVTSMNYMFYGCNALSSLDVSGWDTSNVTSMNYMFYDCIVISSLDVSKWNTSKVTDMKGMFCSCSALESLDLSGWDMKNAVDGDAEYMLIGDYALNKITTPKNLSFSIYLPSKFRDEDGNIYSELPKDLTFSISLTKYIPLTSLKIYCEDVELNSRQWLSLRKNEERTLRAVATPENADISSLIWTSSDPDSVSISSNGVIKAIKDIDYAVITASIPEDPITATAYVRVVTKLEGVSIVPKKNVTLMVGDTLDLAYVTIPEGVAVKSASWKSSAPSIASVDNLGKVTANTLGEADITIELDDKFTDSIRIIVVKKIIPIKEISLSSSSIDLDIGEDQKLSVAKDPEDSTDPVTYSSSNPKVASVDKYGYIEGLSSGEADITVTCGEIVKICHVKVYERLKKLSFEKRAYSIDLDETINITALITPAGFKVPVNWTVKGSEGIVSYTVSADQTVISIKGLSKGRVTVTAAATDSTREPAILKEASCTVTVAGTAVIEPDDSGLIVNGIEDEYIYTGQAVIPDVLVYYNGIRLVEKKEYTISCTNNKAPGTGYMTVKGKGNYAGASAMLPFSIVKSETGSVSIKKASVYGINAKYTFTGSPIYVKDLRIVLGTNELSEGEDYTVSYRSHTDAGTASVVISGIGNYKDSIVKKFKITPADIRMAEMQPISAAYTSGGATPLPELTYTADEDIYVLKYGVDYKVSWKNNGKPGTGSMIIQGRGNFAQKTTKEFIISQGDLKDTVIAVQSVNHKPGQTGSKYMNKVVVYDTNGKTLKAGKDYVLDYYDETSEMVINKGTPAGTVNNGDTIRVSIRPGTSGYYTGSNETDYPVVYQTVSISKQKAAAIPSQEYTGIEIRPEITIYGLTEGEDYEVAAYYNNTAKGNASVLILGQGKFSGYRIIKFKIVARKLK